MSRRYLYTMTFMILTMVTGWTSIRQMESSTSTPQKPAYVLSIHCGASVITKKNISSENVADNRQALNQSLDIGENILNRPAIYCRSDFPKQII